MMYPTGLLQHLPPANQTNNLFIFSNRRIGKYLVMQFIMGLFLSISTVQLKKKIAAANFRVSIEEIVDLGALFMLE